MNLIEFILVLFFLVLGAAVFCGVFSVKAVGFSVIRCFDRLDNLITLIVLLVRKNSAFPNRSWYKLAIVKTITLELHRNGVPR